MEQNVSFQFVRLEEAVALTVILLLVVSVVLIFRYMHLLKKWNSVGFVFTIHRTLLTRVFPLILVIILLGIAFADPYLVRKEMVFERSDVEVCYLFDNAGSVAAAKASNEPQRIERGLSIAQELSESEAMAGVKTCIATFASGPTLHLPATSHVPTIMSVLEDVIVVGDPLPGSRCVEGTTCTDMRSLEEAAEELFTPGADKDMKRVLIVFTDGETRPFNISATVKGIEDSGVDIIFVDLWSLDEEIFDGSNCVEALVGCIDPQYSSDMLGREVFNSFVRISGSVYVAESEKDTLIATVATMLGEPETETNNDPVTTSEERTPYAWLLVLFAGLLLMVACSEHVTDSVTTLKPKRRGLRR